MGKHSKPSPKGISFLTTTAGGFGALIIAAGIFVASGLNGGQPHKAEQPPSQLEPAPTQKIQTASGALDSVISGPASTPVAAPEQATQTPVSTQGPQVPSINVPPVQANTGASVDVQARVPATQVTPDINANVGVDARVRADVPLLGPAVSAVEDTTSTVLDNVNDLLNK